MLRLDTYQINYNGALIWDEPNRKTVFHQPMDCALVRRMIARVRGRHPQALVTCEIMDRWYTDRADQTYTTETGRLFKPDVVAPIDSFCTEPITKLLFLCEPSVIAQVEPMLKLEFASDVTVVRTDAQLVQVMHPRAGKSRALKRVAAHYGVAPREIMAIGDAPNDVGMLQLAGVAVAMDNAHPLVKRVAHWIAPSNDDHGVHAALVRYGLCE
jgi:Cof subfamily protein (haloacid dehalogenase superfamily)